jgi:asparagine synthase (glutamine-hydrolysing)
MVPIRQSQAKFDFTGSFTEGRSITQQLGLPEQQISIDEDLVVAVYGSIYSTGSGSVEETIKVADLILHQYRKNGNLSLSKIDGDYTLIILDGSSVKILRDFKGSGPQVFYTLNYFASTLPLLLECSGHSVSANYKDLSFYMRYGYVPPARSGLEGINRLPAGCLLEYQNGKTEVTPIFQAEIPDEIQPEKSEAEYIEGFTSRHTQAIKQRIRNKEKIALLLSGGYDSGGNLASIRSFYGGKLNAYTISFKDSPLTELEFVKIVSDRFKADLKVYEIDGTELAGLPEIIMQTGVPFQESGMMINYCAMKMVAGDKPDIILGGDGNDQFFGTGAREIAMRYMANKTGGIWLLRLLRLLTGKLNSPEILQKINLYNDKILQINKPDHWGFRTDELKVDSDEENVFTGMKSGSLKKMVEDKRKNVDIRYTINEVILFKASRMAALFGNAISFPYLTLDLLGFIDELPLKYKVGGNLMQLIRGKGKAKYIHKQSYKNVLPTSITSRKKQGGFVPLSIFFNDETSNQRIFKIIEDSELIEKLLKDKRKVIDGLRRSLQHKNSWFWAQQANYFRIFNLLVIALWERLFIKNEKAEDIRLLFYADQID